MAVAVENDETPMIEVLAADVSDGEMYDLTE